MSARREEEDKKAKLLWTSVRTQGVEDDGSSQLGQSSSQHGGLSSSSVNLVAAGGPAANPAVLQSREELAKMYTWDAVFVFAVGDEKETVKVFDRDEGAHKLVPQREHFKTTTAEVVSKLQAAGLYTLMWYSQQKDEIYCKVAASEWRLQVEADRIDYDLQLDSRKCLEYGKGLGVKLAEATSKMEAGIGEDAWQHVYGPYNQLDPERAFRQELYQRYNTEDPKHPRHNSVFRSTDRIKLMVGIIEADAELGGCEISFSRLVADENHSLLAFFPLHEDAARNALVSKWSRLSAAFSAPLNDIRDYFGESVAMYFAFLSFYNRELIWPALVGLGFFVAQIVYGRVDIAPLPIYALYVSMWATLFLEKWKRQTAQLRIAWGMTNFLNKEQPRPEFYGEWKVSPVDGRKEEVFPFYKKMMRSLASQGVIWTLIFVVIASVAGVLIFRKTALEWSPQYGGIVTALLNTVQIVVFNVIYGKVSFMLNDWENHRTDTEYFNALIAKSFLFKFVNSYNTLFYMAFVKKHDMSVRQPGDETGCLNDDCLAELRQQLGTIFISMIVVNNSIEVLLPVIMRKKAERDNAKKPDSMLEEAPVAKSKPEGEYELSPYEGTFDDFDELVIQYGFVTLFVVAFPLAPLLALLNNMLEVRVDSFKVATASRRPEPRGAADIGTWYAILEIMGFMAVVVNCGLIAFASPIMNDWFPAPEDRAYAFILAEHLIILIKLAIAFFVPDEPEDYHIHLRRSEYIVNVLLKGLEEEKEDDDDDGRVSSRKDFDWTVVSDTMPETSHDL